MTALDDCRAAVTAAEAKHADATRRASDAVAALETCELAIGEDESSSSVKAYRAARDEADIARLSLAGAFRKLDSARATLDSAELDEARSTISRLGPMLDRAAVFAKCSRAVSTLLVDLTDDAGDDEVAARAIAQRQAERQIDSIVTEHQAAIGAVMVAHARLGQPAPRIVMVTRQQVDAAVELEKIATQNLDTNTTAMACRYVIRPRTPIHLGPGDSAVIVAQARDALVDGSCYR